jgi:hypothetical protein
MLFQLKLLKKIKSKNKTVKVDFEKWSRCLLQWSVEPLNRSPENSGNSAAWFCQRRADVRGLM